MQVNPIPVLKSLREYVYDFLRDQMNAGTLQPGQFLNLNEISQGLGISKTPLRDALLRLETQGFVTFFPRKGVMVNMLTLDKIRDFYEIIGALEAQTIFSVGDRFSTRDVDLMEELNEEMRGALDNDDFTLFYEKNLDFHDVFLDLSFNQELVKTVRTMKQLLYDFPRLKGFVKEWEVRSTGEHADIISRLRHGDMSAAADYIRDVHWSFRVQERYLRRYYFLQNGDAHSESEEFH